MIIDEIDAYDKKTKEQEANNMEADEPASKKMKIKDYKKTSLLKPINLFIEFLRNLEKDTKKKFDEKNSNINF